MGTSKKITIATVKSFIKKSGSKLHILTQERFDGMQDMVCATGNTEFSPVIPTTFDSRTLGVCGAVFVRGGRDYCAEYNNGVFSGIRISNCCTSFILAVKNN